MKQRRQAATVEHELREDNRIAGAELVSLRAEAEKLRTEAGRLTTELRAVREKQASTDQKTDAMGTKILELDALLRDTYKALQVAEGRVATLLARLDEEAAERSSLQHDRDTMALELQNAQRQVTRLQQQASDAENALRQSTALTTRLQGLIDPV
eukprot:m.166756 g.166756  ORF g.166756 m.166756 type:complete len:155 (+) comp12736_c0_seq1:117-581(+)